MENIGGGCYPPSTKSGCQGGSWHEGDCRGMSSNQRSLWEKPVYQEKRVEFPTLGKAGGNKELKMYSSKL